MCSPPIIPILNYPGLSPMFLFRLFKQTFVSFVWAQKKPRIARTMLIRTKLEGGLVVQGH